MHWIVGFCVLSAITLVLALMIGRGMRLFDLTPAPPLPHPWDGLSCNDDCAYCGEYLEHSIHTGDWETYA